MEGAGAHSGLVCWLLDTRTLWPGQKITDSESAKVALKLVSKEEREEILRKYHSADARMTLGSALLKRLFVHKVLGAAWEDIRFGRQRDPTHGKPCALMPSSDDFAPIEFNISHQAGLVALVGCKLTELNVELGVDIVCVNERNENRAIDTEGFDGWVDIYEEIFSRKESDDIKYNVEEFTLKDGSVIAPEMLGDHTRCVERNHNLDVILLDGSRRSFSSNELLDAKLRRFYTFWCYKEAYIKLDGEALLAKWIPELEFRNVRAPHPNRFTAAGTMDAWGERVNDAEVWWSGSRNGPRNVSQGQTEGEGPRHLQDTKLDIQAFEESFMIGVAAKEKGSKKLPRVSPIFTSLNLENDVIATALQA